MFLASAGLQGDTPAGILENVRFNPRTGALWFTARLTLGATILPGGKQKPSQDIFDFSGKLKAAVLTGTLERPQVREHVQLKLQQPANMLQASSYAEWKRQVDEILKFRGPRW